MRVKRIVEYNKNKVGSITSSEFMANLLSWKLYSCQPCYINQVAGLISGTREASTHSTFICYSVPLFVRLFIRSAIHIVFYGILWYSLILYGIIWYFMVLHGIAWNCLVLHGVALYSMVLHSIV